MNQLSKTTIIGFLFLFLGTIELICFGIPCEINHDLTFISIFLFISACIHLILGYGFLLTSSVKRLAAAIEIEEPHAADQEPTTKDEKDPS